MLYISIPPYGNVPVRFSCLRYLFPFSEITSHSSANYTERPRFNYRMEIILFIEAALCSRKANLRYIIGKYVPTGDISVTTKLSLAFNEKFGEIGLYVAYVTTHYSVEESRFCVKLKSTLIGNVITKNIKLSKTD